MFSNKTDILYATYSSIKRLNSSQIVRLFDSGKQHNGIYIQEKLNGSNIRLIYKNDELIYGSRYKIGSIFNIRQHHDTLVESLKKLKTLLDLPDEFMVVGELIGHMKNSDYFFDEDGKPMDKNDKSDFYAYSIYVNGKYLDFLQAQDVLRRAEFATIPTIGPIQTAHEMMTLLNEPKSFIHPNALKEGNVIHVNGKMFKFIHKNFHDFRDSENHVVSLSDYINEVSFGNFLSSYVESDDKKTFEDKVTDYYLSCIEDYYKDTDKPLKFNVSFFIQTMGMCFGTATIYVNRGNEKIIEETKAMMRNQFDLKNLVCDKFFNYVTYIQKFKKLPPKEKWKIHLRFVKK